MDRTEFLSSVGRRIAKARKSAGISQAELAELTDLSVSCISKIERGININNVVGDPIKQF